MRKLLSVMVVIAASLALVHCASGGTGSNSSKDQADQDAGDNGGDDTPHHDAGKKAPPSDQDAAPPPPPKDAGADVDAARPPPVDAGPPKPPPPPPSAACSALASCCPALASSTDQGACWVAIDYTAGHSMLNSAECGATYAVLDCATAVARLDLGPSCSQLAACCNSQEYGPYIEQDTACSDDWRSGNEDLCDADLQSYYADEYGDCL